MSIAATEDIAHSGWRKHRWTTAQFDAMLDHGLLREGSKTFLWDGEIFDPAPETEAHANANAQDNLSMTLLRRLPETEWTIRPAHPLALKDGFKPQPDIAVLIGRRKNDRRHAPTADDAALVVEIVDSSYAEDAGFKLPEYAAAGIPRYWIVHIRARRIEVYSAPIVTLGVGRYADRRDYVIGEAITLVLSRDAREFGLIPVLDILRDSLEEE